jgi:hypothetical protein
VDSKKQPPNQKGKRFPLEPLAKALGIPLVKPSLTGSGGYPVGHGALAQALGVNTRTIRRYAKEGIPEKAADLYAIKAARRLPFEIWPNYYDDLDPNDTLT